MVLVYINGGLGNQIFQYMIFRWLEQAVGEECVLDDGLFFGKNVPHHGYELERIFGVRPRRLSELIPADAWQFMVERREKSGIGIAQQLLDGGMPLTVIRERGVTNISFNGRIVDYSMGEDIPRISGNAYIHGYWLGTIYYQAVGDLLRQELAFPPIQEGWNIQYAAQIQECRCPVAIHVRRGDMVTLGWSCEAEFFGEAVRYAAQEFPVDRLFLFSDDLDWCRAHQEELGLKSGIPVTEVSGNTGLQAFRDLQLMSLCQGRISDRSSFSLLAGVLCTVPDKWEINHWQ